MHRMWKRIASAAFVAASASTAQAQAQGMGFGLHLGAAMPTGRLGDGLSTGFQVGGELGFNPAALPVGVRIDVDFSQFGFKGDGDGNFRILSGTANAILKVPATSISPYLVGGLGMFNQSAGGGGGSSTDFGFQIGGGLGFNLSGFETAVELKLVNILTEGESGRFIPITFRIMFGGAGDTGGTGMRVR